MANTPERGTVAQSEMSKDIDDNLPVIKLPATILGKRKAQQVRQCYLCEP